MCTKFPSPKTKFPHMSLSAAPSFLTLSLVILHLTPSIHLYLGLHFLRVLVRPLLHSTIFYGNLFPGMLLTRPDHGNFFPPVCSHTFVPPSTDSLMVFLVLFFFPPMPPTCPCGLRGLPSWAWQKCNRLLRLGRP